MSTPPDAVVVDLGAVGRASAALARWYRGLVANGEGDVDELGRARMELATLPAQPGRLGWAVRLVVCGGDDPTDEEVVAAVNLLCDAASRAAGPSTTTAIQSAAVAPRRRRRGRAATVTQPTLPGLGPGGAA